MQTASSALEQYLDELAGHARAGQRLPTIRELMRRFGASQMLVQRALAGLKARGLIESHVGRGTHFVDAASGTASHELVRARPGMPESSASRQHAAAARSVLLLRRSVSVRRGRVVLDELQRRLAAEGCRVLEVAYNDPEHALMVLRALPSFDACVVQSTYKTIPIAMLAALRETTSVIAVDGLALVGADVEAVGMEWGAPLALAIARLQSAGHRSIGVAMTSQPFLAAQLGWRRLAQVREAPGAPALHELAMSGLPDGSYFEEMLQAMQSLRQAGRGRLPFTALVAWGIEDGAALRERLAAMGLGASRELSVVLLGRTDLDSEHAGHFHTVGCAIADQVDALRQAIARRWIDPASGPGVTLVPLTERQGASVATLRR